MNRLERRVITTEFRTVKASGKPTRLVGYGAVFNSDSEDLGGFVEQIAPGAFTEVLASNPDCRCLLNHDPSAILGRTKSGTLVLRQDSIGLHYDCLMPDTTLGRDLLVSAERGDITQSSFGFRVGEEDDDEEWYDRNGRRVANWSFEGIRRVIKRVAELFDVSPVTYPAYTASSVEARSLFLFPEGRPQRSTGSTDDALQRSGRKLILNARRRRDALRDIAQRRIDLIREQL